jgi:ketosteroid isomerase-like protein
MDALTRDDSFVPDALTHEAAVRLAQDYVGAYNDRSLESMLALMDPDIVSYPSRLFGPRQDIGHDAVRAWWQTMAERDQWYEVVIRDIRVVGEDRVAALGQIHDHGEPVSSWGVVFRVRDGLIVESRSYLSDEDLLAELGLLG